MNTIDLSIVAREGIAFKEKAVSMNIPTKTGELTILPKHTELVTSLKKGKIVVKKENGEQKELNIRGGVLEVRRNSVVMVLADIIKEEKEI